MTNLFAELKRRNVVRVGGSYLAVSWAVMQVVDTLADPLSLPDRFATVLLVLLGLGFPVSLVLAWIFEITADGVVRTEEVDPNAPARPHKGRTSNIITATALVIALGYIGWDAIQDHEAAPDEWDSRSIAVLPFADMSPGGDQAWFGDGVADAILHDLAQSDELKVISRSSSFTFRGDGVDIPAAASALGARFILEGSVTRAQDRVRVIAQLIDAATDSHVWSETFNRSLDDIFAVQTEIATAIAGALSVTLGVGEVEAAPSLESYDLILRARAAQLERSDAGLRESIALLEAAVRSDPRSADALGELALARLLLPYWESSLGPDGVREIREAGDSAAAAALALNPYQVEALVAAGANLTLHYEFEEAEALFLRALEVSPGSALVYNWYGDLLQFWGRGADAVQAEARAAELDPLQPANHMNLGQAQFMIGDFDAAVASFHRALELAPDLLYPKVGLMASLYRQEAWVELYRAAEQTPDPEARALNRRAAEVLETLGQGDSISARQLVLDWRPGTSDEREWGSRLLLLVGEYDHWVSVTSPEQVIMPFGANFFATDTETLDANPAYGAFMRSPPRDKLLRARNEWAARTTGN